MTVSEARSRCAELHVLPWDDPRIHAAAIRATATLVAASPQVTPAAGAPGLWWVGASGFGYGVGERALLQTLLQIARQWHPQARVGLADSCVAARAATWDRQGAVIVAPGGCAAYLDRAPLGLIPIDDDVRESLRALGLHTVGALARLAADDVERRWGDVGLSAWRLAHGIDERRPGLYRLDAPRAVTTELTPSVSTTEPLLFLARAGLERLLAGLIADGRAAAVIAVTLILDDVRQSLPVPTQLHTVTREVRLPQPLARLTPLVERCRGLLEAWQLTAPVRGITIAITASAPLSGTQGELLEPAWRDPAAAEAAFARLRSALGSEAIVMPMLRDTHRPEERGVWVVREEDGLTGWGDGLPTRGTSVGGAPPEQHHTTTAAEKHHPTIAARTEVSPVTVQTSVAPTSDHSPLNIPEATPRAYEGERPRQSAAVEREAHRFIARDRGAPPDNHDTTPAPLQHTHFHTPRTTTPPLPLTPPTPTALRQLHPPERVEISLNNNRPHAIRWRDRWVRIQHAIGPERLTGEWWDRHYARDYWRCETAETGAALMVYHDLASLPNAPDTEAWYVQGWYD